MRTLTVLAILVALAISLPLMASDTQSINTPKLVSDNYGGVCYIRQPYQGRNPEPIAPTVVHRYADGYEEVYSNPERVGTTIGSTIACTPEFVYFTVNTNGVVVNKLYRQHFGTNVAEESVIGSRFVETLDVQTKGNRVLVTAVNSQSEIYVSEVASGGKLSIVADLGQFSNFAGSCATSTGFFALLNVGNLSQLMELTPQGVNTKLAITANGDGALTCNNYDAYVAYHNGNDLIVSASNGYKTVYANTPGKMNGFAIADNGNAMVVMNYSGNQTYSLAGGKASKTAGGPLSLVGLPTTVVVSNYSFSIGSYFPRR
jgi:hypothetical protein